MGWVPSAHAYSSMTPAEFAELGQILFPDGSWKARLARRMKVNGATIRKWAGGVKPISRSYAEFLRTLVLYEAPASLLIREEAVDVSRRPVVRTGGYRSVRDE